MALIVSLFYACGNGSFSDKKKVYTCPMHPEIISDKPGICPICKMDLELMETNGESTHDSDLSYLLKPANEFVLSQVKTIKLTEKEMPIEFHATGIINYDTRFVNTVSSRVTGRIEKLYVKYKYQSIHKGAKIMDIYSKELATEQENYLFLLRNDSENKAIIKAAEIKLELMGLTKTQIEELKTTKKTSPTITIYSPYHGHLHDFNGMAASSSMDNETSGNQALLLREGVYVEKGQTLFNIYSLDKVWAVLNIYPEGQSLINIRQKVDLQIDGANRSNIYASIDFIEPTLNTEQKTTSVRVYLNNSSGDLKPGAVVRATIEGKSKKGNYVPASAVLDLGLNQIVFISQNKLFKPQLVKVGVSTNGWKEIITGINLNDSVAENAQMLMDSESFIKL